MLDITDKSPNGGAAATLVDRSPRARILTILLLALFCVSLMSVWLIPAVSGYSENRLPAQLPELSPAALVDDTTYQQIDRVIRDKVGARSVASRAVGAFSVDVTGASPTYAVFLGEGRLPYVGEDFTAPCINSDASFARVQSGLSDWGARFAAADKYLMYVVPPDKSAIRRDELGPLGESLMICSDRSRAQLEDWAAEADFPFLTLWDAESAQDEQYPGAYLFGDTHWNWHGASVMTKAVLTQLVTDGEAPDAVLADLDSLVVDSDKEVAGDLYRLMGLDRTESATIVVSDRPEVITTREKGTSPAGLPETRWTSKSDTAEFVPGRTLIMGDSFLAFTESQLPGFFEDVTYMKTATAPTPGELASMGDFDRVIVERVQRFAAYERTGLLFDLSFSLK